MGRSEGPAVTFIKNFHTLIAVRFFLPTFSFNLNYRSGRSFSCCSGGGCSCCGRGFLETVRANLGIVGSVST